MGERHKRTLADDEDQRGLRDEEHARPSQPETLEGPGGRDESKGEEDARDKTTRRGES